MGHQVADPLLLIGEVSEVRGARVKLRVYGEANETHIFYRGGMVRGVSVGGYVKIPCGFDDVIGVIEGDYQQERHAPAADTSDGREAPGGYLERFVDVSIFGVMSQDRFDRGVSVLPLVRSKAYVLAPDELDTINSPAVDDAGRFRIGSLAGHDGAPVTVPTNKLFASHIGVFGNTGSGKSNTLCRLFTDYLEGMADTDGLPNRFVFIDFNGEYVGVDTIAPAKTTYKLNTRKGGDRIPVSSSFYSDVDMWAMLSQATERTQRPFLKRCISKAVSISRLADPAAYMKGMTRRLLESYASKAAFFDDQREDLIRLLSIACVGTSANSANELVAQSLDVVHVRPGGSGILTVHNSRYPNNTGYLNLASDVGVVFEDLLALQVDYDTIAKNPTKLLEFVARLRYLEQWRDGAIVHEHIAPWISRYVSQLREASKLYETMPTGSEGTWPSCTVVSLLDVNQEQKKVVPLVIARTLYQEQKRRGREDEHSSTHLVIDEAHNILSYSSQRESEDWRDYRLETFEEIVKEGRKFGMYLTVCSQRPADISPTIISQMHNYFIHRLVNDEDLRAISKAVAFIDAANMSMVPVLPQGCCIVSGTATSYPVRVQVDMLERERQPQSFDRELMIVRREP